MQVAIYKFDECGVIGFADNDALFTAERQSEERREGYMGRAETAEESADEKVIRDTAAKARKAALRKE